MADPQKITEFTEVTAPVADDILPIVVDVGGVPVTRKVPLSKINNNFTLTAAEIAAGITSIKPEFEPGDIRRYGAGTGQLAAVNDTAIKNALLANDLVRIPQDGDGSVYEITSSFTLGRSGQRVVGDITGNVISVDSSDNGPRFSVETGFPITGGDAAQSVFVVKSRNQRIENIGIDCNNIALHGVFGTGGLITRLKLLNMLIQFPAGDGVLMFDSTFINSFESVIVGSAGGWGFNFDATSGSSGHTTLSFINCYAPTATSGGFRFDAVSGFAMDACACDSTSAFAVRLENGSVGTIDGMDTEDTTRLFDLSENASLKSRLTVSGSRFLQFGDNATPPANVIDNGGTLTIQNSAFQGGEAATLFLETDSGSETNWYGNTLDLESETNSFNNSSVIRADHWIHTSNTSAAVERLRIESASTPRVHLREIGQAKDGQIVVESGVLKIQRIDGTTLSVDASNFTLDLTTGDIVLTPGSGGDMTLGSGTGTLALNGKATLGSGGGSVGFFTTTPITKRTVTGSRGGNAALTSLLTQLAAYGLIVNSTT